MYLFHEPSYRGAQLRDEGPILVYKSPVRRVEDGRFVHLHLQAALQLVGLEAHQEAHGDGAQGHEQAQSDGETWEPPLDRGLGRALAHRLTSPDRVAGRIHAEIPLQSPLDGKGKLVLLL